MQHSKTSSLKTQIFLKIWSVTKLLFILKVQTGSTGILVDVASMKEIKVSLTPDWLSAATMTAIYNQPEYNINKY
jgi:hypothetical protein